MLEVTMPVNTAIVPNLAQFFQQPLERNLADRSSDTELSLMGDSITKWWRREGGNSAVLARISHRGDRKRPLFGA
jgi:hypothetical protein